MRIRFLGAAGDVTGSAYHVVTKDASILVDCGLFQGRKEESAKNLRKQQIEDGKLDAVVLTHGHLDHIGRLPLLTRKGYKGPVYATRPTLDLTTLILKDSQSIQKQDLKRQNQKRARAIRMACLIGMALWPPHVHARLSLMVRIVREQLSVG